jgi:DNA-binding MarR family transcriptional regulator
MPAQDLTRQIEDACRLIAAGRSTARRLDSLVRDYDLNEAGFRLLWTLKKKPAFLDQKQLADELGLSAAQVSSLVERLRMHELIEARTAPGDRRRQPWKLTSSGRKLIEKIVREFAKATYPRLLPSIQREEAA